MIIGDNLYSTSVAVSPPVAIGVNSFITNATLTSGFQGCTNDAIVLFSGAVQLSEPFVVPIGFGGAQYAEIGSILTITAQATKSVSLNDLVIFGDDGSTSTIVLTSPVQIAGDGFPTTLLFYTVPQTFINANSLSFQAFLDGYAVSFVSSITVLQVSVSFQPPTVTTQSALTIFGVSTYQITSSSFSLVLTASNGVSSTIALGPNVVVGTTSSQLAVFTIPASFNGSTFIAAKLYNGTQLLTNSAFTVELMNFVLSSNPSSAFAGLSLTVSASSNVTQAVDTVIFSSDTGNVISVPVTVNVVSSLTCLTTFVVPTGFASDSFQINAFYLGVQLNDFLLKIPIESFILSTVPAAYVQIGAPLSISGASIHCLPNYYYRI